MKKTTLLFLLLICSFTGFCKPGAAKIYFRFKKGIPLAVGNEGIVCAKHNNELYYATESYLNNTFDSPSILIYVLNFNSDKTDSFKLSLPHHTLWSLSCLTVNDKYIAIKCDSIYIFERNSKKLINFFSSYHSNEIKFLDSNRLLIYKNYDFHPLDDSIKTNLIIYNIEKKQLISSIKPQFNYIGYTHLVSEYIAVNSDKIAFAQTMPYDVKIFSTKDLSQISEITEAFNNDPKQLEKIDSLHQVHNHNFSDVKEFIFKLKAIDSITRIEKVLFLTDDTLLISKKIPQSGFKERALDVWVLNKKNKKWSCIVKDQFYKTEKNDTNYLVTSESLPIDLTFSSPMIEDGHTIYLSGEYVPPVIGDYSNNYKKYQDTYYSTNEIKQFLWMFTWEIK